MHQNRNHVPSKTRSAGPIPITVWPELQTRALASHPRAGSLLPMHAYLLDFVLLPPVTAVEMLHQLVPRP